jgi:hypothetical protein
MQIARDLRPTLRRLRAAAVLLVTAALLPTSPLVAAPAASVVPTAAPSGLPYSFVRSGFVPRELPVEKWQYNGPGAISLVDSRAHDKYGVRMVVVHGTQYNHPYGQAAYGMQLLNAYRVTNDARYLMRARAQARRLLDTHVVSRGAWFLPHRYPFARHSNPSDRMPEPFYSAMAQGTVLGFFTRMYRVTGETGFRSAADAVFASFLLPKATGKPWVVEVDTANRLWLEEWPKDGDPDFTYNGHTFATYGLYDYALLTKDSRAVALFDGATTTTLRVAKAIRTPGWISKYCFAHRLLSAGYHAVHTRQLLSLQALTGEAGFASWSDLFREDYAAPALRGTVLLAAGRHTGYVFSASGHPTASRTATLARAARVTIDRRTRVYGNGGYWYHVTNGTWAGYLVREAPAQAYLLGSHPQATYDPARRLAVSAGDRVYAVRLSSSGQVTERRTFDVSSGSTMGTTARSLVEGRSMLRADDGWLVGWWVYDRQVRLT